MPRSACSLPGMSTSCIFARRGRSSASIYAAFEDVSQLVFTELAQQAPRLVRHPSLRGWLYLCTRHVVTKALRTECRRLGARNRRLVHE